MRSPIKVNYRGRILEVYFGIDGTIWVWLDAAMAKRMVLHEGQNCLCSSGGRSLHWLMVHALQKNDALLETLVSISWRFPREAAELGYSGSGWIRDYQMKYLGWGWRDDLSFVSKEFLHAPINDDDLPALPETSGMQPGDGAAFLSSGVRSEETTVGEPLRECGRPLDPERASSPERHHTDDPGTFPGKANRDLLQPDPDGNQEAAGGTAPLQMEEVWEPGSEAGGGEEVSSRKKQKGRAVIEFDRTVIAGNRHEEKVEIPIFSIWQDPINNNAVKAHMLADSRNIQHRIFYNTMLRRGFHRTDDGSMHLLAGDRFVIRYGINYENPLDYKGSDELFNDYWIYDSKAIAFKAIIQRAADYGIAIGGLQDVNFNLIPDAVLSSFGFSPVPDLMRRSVTMWKGNPSEVFRSTSYQSHEKTRDHAQMFLKTVDDAIQGKL